MSIRSKEIRLFPKRSLITSALTISMLLMLFMFSTVVKATTESYYPLASRQHLSLHELRNTSVQELSVMRNEIFARKGLIYTQEPLKSYFESKSWYKPQYEFSIDIEDQITAIEQANLIVIQAQEGILAFRSKDFYASFNKFNNIALKAKLATSQSAKEALIQVQRYLGLQHEFGHATVQNINSAGFYYKTAALQGDAWSVNKLGKLFEAGKGVEKNYATAGKLYHYAANKGSKLARNNLNKLIASGKYRHQTKPETTVARTNPQPEKVYRPQTQASTTNNTEELYTRVALKIVGALSLNALSQCPSEGCGFLGSMLAGASRLGRDALVDSAIAEIFPEFADKTIRGTRRIISLIMDGELTAKNYAGKTTQEELMLVLEKEAPELKGSTQVVSFLYEVYKASN